MAAAMTLAPERVNVRMKIAALWTSMMFIVAYVDIFGFYRPDYRADIEAGEVSRIANVIFCVVYALTILVAAIGEWNYYILGSAIELAQLAGILYYAWTWPKEVTPATVDQIGLTTRLAAR